MAGALGVQLAKAEHYVLNASGRAPRPGDIGRARRLIMRAMLLSAAVLITLKQC
jgi:cobalamin biosynthesis protein CobD/CbiB